MRRILSFLFVICFSTICWDTLAFAGGATTCSLSASNAEIIAGQTATWTVSSTPSGLPYVWHVDDPFGHTDVAGEKTTGWSGSYTYNTPGTYSAYFSIPQGIENAPCTSNVAQLVVDPVFIAGTNIFPQGGTFVQGQNIDLRTYSNIATGVSLDWAVVVIDEQLVGAFSQPQTPLNAGWGFNQTIGNHQIRVIMGTSAGQFENDANFQIILNSCAIPQQVVPGVFLVGTCLSAPPPPQPPLPGVGDTK